MSFAGGAFFKTYPTDGLNTVDGGGGRLWPCSIATCGGAEWAPGAVHGPETTHGVSGGHDTVDGVRVARVACSNATRGGAEWAPGAVCGPEATRGGSGGHDTVDGGVGRALPGLAGRVRPVVGVGWARAMVSQSESGSGSVSVSYPK